MSSSLPAGTFLSDVVKIRANQYEKEKKDFERQREIIDHLDVYYGDYRDYKRIEKFKINYELLNGHLDVALYEDPLSFTIKGDKGYEEISFDFQNISHTPLIAQYANAIIGEQLNKPFKPMIKDWTPNRPTLLKKRANKVNKQYIVENIVNPMRTQIMNQIMQEAGQTDIFTFASTPQQQMQLEQEINQRLTDELPRDILEFINGDVISTTAKQAQKMLNYIIDMNNIKFKQVNGFKHAVATGEEYYYVGVYNGQLTFEEVHPSFLTWGGGDRENEWSQHADYIKRERWLSYQQIISRHSDKIDKKDLELIELDVEPVGGFYKGVPFWDKDAAHTKKFMYTFSVDEGLREIFSDINIKTKEGRQKLFHAYDLAFGRYADTYGTNHSDYGVREAHFQWRDLRPMWELKQKQQDGSYRKFFLPEFYEPTHNDEEVREIWVNQAWEGWKLGTFSCVYTGIKPLDYQYKSIFNPHDVDLTYYGKKYNSHNNTTGNVALIDLAKTANKNFDMVLASIRQDLATNHGKAFTLFMNMKPEGYTFQMWIDALRHSGLLLLDPTRGNAGMDLQFLKEIDLSKMSDIAGKIQTLEFFRQQVALSMYFNDAREGAVSQYANATNVQQNTTAVHNKTAYFMEQHRQVVEKALTGFLNCARHYYKDNIEQASIFLDDTSIIELQNTPLSWYEWLAISLQNSEEELQKLQMLKSEMMAFIQNGASAESIMELVFADTILEASDIIRRETKRQQQEIQAAREHEASMKQQEIQAKSAEKQAEMQLEWQKHMAELESQEKRTLWDREKFKMQNDVDENKINDMIQKALIEVNAKMKISQDELNFEREKMQLQGKIEREKIKKMSQNSKKVPSKK